ncbi:MAG: c-type cytochrome biogenesis protein CcsB [Desulfobulbus propionicus]|nr:MAG: c-type cytochrome biogenesis protein CcsB [Desulfobulbus propionicus]
MSVAFFQLSLFGYFLAAIGYLIFFFSQKKKIRLVASKVFLFSAVFQTLTIVVRYLETGHTPSTSHHETVSFFACAVAWCYLSFRWRYTVKSLDTFASVLVLLLMIVAAFSSQAILPLSPVDQSWWRPVHASVTLVANAFFAISCLGSIMYLLQEREIKGKRFGLFYPRLPSLEVLNTLSQHCLNIGFALLTLGIVTGLIWAKQVWGVYWHWDPKETWALITWMLYAAVMHLRFTVKWRGKRVAILSIVAFLSVLFTLWGVSFFMKGAHYYAA